MSGSIPTPPVSVAIATERAIAATLSAVGAPCGLDRDYESEYVAAQLPSMCLVANGWEPSDHDSDNDSVGIVAEWALVLRAAGTLDVPGSEAMDVLLTWAWSRLYFDQTLANSVRLLSVSKTSYQYDRKDDSSVVQCQLDIKAIFDVQRGDLAANYNVEG